MNISKVGFTGSYCIQTRTPKQAGELENCINCYNSPEIKRIKAINGGEHENCKVYVNTSERQYSPADMDMLGQSCRVAGLTSLPVNKAFKAYAKKTGLIDQA